MPPSLAKTSLLELSSHYDELLAFVARRVSSRVLAADIVQDSYLRLAALATGEAVANPRAYLFRTAANLVTDHWRLSGRQGVPFTEASTGTEDDPTPDPCPSPEAQALSGEELAVLAAAIETLPPRTREVFRLHKFDHLTYGEIAEQLGIAKNTVVVHMVRALAHCRRRLAQYHDGG